MYKAGSLSHQTRRLTVQDTGALQKEAADLMSAAVHIVRRVRSAVRRKDYLNLTVQLHTTVTRPPLVRLRRSWYRWKALDTYYAMM